MSTTKKVIAKKATTKKVVEKTEEPVKVAEVKQSKFVNDKLIEGSRMLKADFDGKYYTIVAANGNIYKLPEAEYKSL